MTESPHDVAECHFQTWLACSSLRCQRPALVWSFAIFADLLDLPHHGERNNALLVAFPLGVNSCLCLLKCITFPNVYATSLGSIVLTKVLRVVPRVIVPPLI